MLRRTPRDIVLVTDQIVPAQSQISVCGDCIPPQILNLFMMQNGKRYRKDLPHHPSIPGMEGLHSAKRICHKESPKTYRVWDGTGPHG